LEVFGYNAGKSKTKNVPRQPDNLGQRSIEEHDKDRIYAEALQEYSDYIVPGEL
jgi:hypothetical protein